MKQRFSSLDIKVISHELSEALCGLRVANIYDLSSRIFLFKFARPNNRKQVVVDSGFRCHLTKFSRATASEPSAFVARLRKFLRTRRVTSVSQVGTDRVILFQFGDGQYKLILEFFAGGNIILTDRDFNIISLLRTVPKSENQDEQRVGLKYSLEDKQNFAGVPPLTPERVRDGLQKANERAKATSQTGKKGKQKPGDAVRKALATSLNEFPPMLLEHALTVKGFDVTKSLDEVLGDAPTLDVLMEALHEAQDVVTRIMSKEICTGYIIAKAAKNHDSAATSRGAEKAEEDVDKENAALVFDDFHPFLPKQVDGQAGTTVLEIEGFNATVDQFFSSIESQKLETRLQERHDHANKKLEATRNDHASRVEVLQQVQQLNVRKAQAIENNVLWVNEACAAVNGLIAQGMDWAEIAQLIEMEQGRKNPVAQLIKLPLKLYENTVTLVLSEYNPIDDDDGMDMADETDGEESADDERDPDETKRASKESEPKLSVDIDLALTPWANARQYYDQKKSAAVKEEKTKHSSMSALKSAEHKVKADLQKGLKKEKDVLRPVRKQLWFEKFYHFISSEGYLVVAGHDKAQTEMIYSRYFQPGDAWVYSEVQGAAPAIVMNKRNARKFPIPPLTLSQAGSFCIMSSSAWDSKAVMGAWWVECRQVTKLDSTGQYLGPGDFIFKGEKQQLPPAQLLLGFGVMFRVSPESKARHTRHHVKDADAAQAADATQAKDAETQEHLALGDSSKEIIILEDDDALSEHSAPESDEESALGEQELDESTATGYSNPLQAQRADGAEPVQIDSQLQDLSLERAEEDAPEAASSDSSDGEDSNAEAVTASVEPGVTQSQAEIAPTVASEAQSSISKPEGRVRGKRGKQAKMKAKYADQDEEDRELAMKLLGSRPGQEKRKDGPEAKLEREALALQQKERRREQHRRAQDTGKVAEEERQKLIQSEEELMSPEDLAELDFVENFVGSPLPTDDILDCLVICGPWDAMGTRLRWRTKLQPGTVKKGKAVKEILGSWNKFIAEKEKRKLPPPQSDIYEEEKQFRREGDMIKTFRDVELIGVIPVGKVRLVTGGGGGGGGGGKGKGAKQASKSGKGGKKKR